MVYLGRNILFQIMDSLALPYSTTTHYRPLVSPPILKFRTNRIFKSKCNKKIQLIACRCSLVKGEYGGWDDLDRSNDLRSKNGIVGDWLQNWENDRGKSLLVMGFGVVFAWSVARPRALWWVCLPLSGFMLLLFFHDYTTQDNSSRSRSRSTTTPNSNRSSSEHDDIKSSLTNQFAMLYNVMLNFLSLDKSAQEILPVHNDISFGELWQYLKTFKVAVSKSNKSTQPESSAKEFKLEPQIWRRILEEDGLDGEDASDSKLGYTVSKTSPVVAGTKDKTLHKNERLRKSSESRTKDLITNGYSQQSLVAELGQAKLNGRETHPSSVQSAHGGEREITIADLERSRQGDSNQGEEWRRKACTQNSDESPPEELSTTNCGYERDQLPHKDGSVFLQLGSSKRLEELGLGGKKSSSNYRGMISQPAEHLNEEYAEQQNVLHKYTRRNSQTLNNHVNFPMPSSGIKETVKNPLTSSAAENEGIIIEHGLLQTDKSSSICLDGTNILQKSSHFCEASMIEEPRISTQGGSHECRGNVNDRYGEQNGVAERKSLVDNSDSDSYNQAAVSRRQVAANSCQSEHSESLKVQDLPFSENLKEFFQMCLDKGGTLLKEAKKGLQGKSEVCDAESMLYEAADIFSTAAALDPSSLVAVGQWGNTLLVHGELKLKLSQELRSSLQSRDYSLSKKARRYQPDELRLAMMDRETIAETLHQVCEECDKLLVEAGRKYRKALLLDKYDVRSLYNWGLALCFRAQLFSGGGEAFFGVYDGHGGHKAADFVAEKLGQNIVDLMVKSGDLEKAIKAGYVATDKQFLEQQGVGSGACCVTALIKDGCLVVGNVGDFRVVLNRNRNAEALSWDNKPGTEKENVRPTPMLHLVLGLFCVWLLSMILIPLTRRYLNV